VSIAMAGKKIKLYEEAIIEILVADTNSESGSEASEFGGERRRRGSTTTASLGRNRNTGCNKWWITNMGTTPGKEHKYSSFLSVQQKV